MLDLYEVLREKENSIAQVRREVEALRLVCEMLGKEGDTFPDTVESPTDEETDEDRDSTSLVTAISERQAIVAGIRSRLANGKPDDSPEQARSVVVQFRDAALGASRALLRRVPYGRFFEGKSQQNAIRNLFERFGRNAA